MTPFAFFAEVGREASDRDNRQPVRGSLPVNLRVRFRGKLLLLALVPLAFAQLVTLLAGMRVIESDVEDRARETLHLGAAVVGEYLHARSEQLQTSVEVLAADFGLKEALATGDVGTIRSVLHNHSRRIGADLAIASDLEGRIIAATTDTENLASIPAPEVLGAPGGTRTSQFTIQVRSTVYQMFSVEIRAPMPIARVAVGFPLDRAMIERVQALTGLDTALVTGTGREQIVIASTAADFGVGALFSIGKQTAGGVELIDRPNTGYLSLITSFVDPPANRANVAIVLLLSMTEAMVPYVDARHALIVFTGLLLLVVAATGAWLAGRFAEPLNKLNEAVRQIISGNYGFHVSASSKDEVGELADSFNSMRSAIAEREKRISHQALHDSLTDLPNHSNIVGHLTRAIEAASKSGSKVFVLSIRLGRMASITSTLGHDASDELIALAARHLRINLEPDEILGHIGTYEFVVIRSGDDIEATLEIANRLCEILAIGVTLGRVNISLQSEIGLAYFPDHGDTAAGLLRSAAIARSETEARGTPVAVFERGRENFHVRQLRIVNDLRGAIHREDVEVWYQPKISLPDGRPVGAEALVRWRHSEYGWLPPDEFVRAAEEAGTIVHLTRYVLRRAILDCRKWQEAGHKLNVSVNISARDLCDDYLPYYVLQLLKESEVEPCRLTLEVTESSVMQNVRRAITVLDCLRDVGVRISMDDFGTGQSSLAQLRNIPLHELKVDKSFILSLPDNAQDAAIVRATVDLAHSLNLEVVAEGVENEEALRMLSGIGCEQAQGYFMGKPVPPTMFLSWMSEFKPVSYEDRRAGDRPFMRSARSPA